MKKRETYVAAHRADNADKQIASKIQSGIIMIVLFIALLASGVIGMIANDDFLPLQSPEKGNQKNVDNELSNR